MLSQIDMLSFNESQPTLSGMAYTCDIYSSPEISSLRQHLLYHISRIPTVTPDNGILMVTFPDCIWENDVLPVLAEYILNTFLNVPETHMVLNENNLLRTVKSKI